MKKIKFMCMKESTKAQCFKEFQNSYFEFCLNCKHMVKPVDMNKEYFTLQIH